MSTGERIKRLREDNSISQTELAEDVRVSKQTLYKYENDIVTNIPSDKLELIADKLDTTPEYLMGWTDDPIDYEKLDIVIPSWWEGTIKGYTEFQNALEKDQEIDSSLHAYWNKEKLKSISYHEFIHRYLDYESSYTSDGKNVDIKLNQKPNVAYRVSAEEYENFYNYTKDRLDSEFNYLLKKAQELPAESNVSQFVEETPSYLLPNAAHERTDIEFTEEDRQADEDMLD